EMRVAPLGIFEPVESKASDFQDIDAGKPGVWLRGKHTAHRMRKRLVHGLMAGFEINRSHNDGRVGQITGQCPTWADRTIASLPQPAPRDSQYAIPVQAAGAWRRLAVVGVLQREDRWGRRGIARLRIDLWAAQDISLQPRGDGGPQSAGRHWIPPQPPAPIIGALRLTEWPFSGRE